MNGHLPDKTKKFWDFEIWIGPPATLPKPGEPASYPTIVTTAPEGPAFGTLQLEMPGIFLFDLVGEFKTDLEQSTLSNECRAAFAQVGFPLADPITVVQQKVDVWRIAADTANFVVVAGEALSIYRDTGFLGTLSRVRSGESSLALRREFGALLFNALFSGDVAKCWSKSKARIQERGPDGLRLRLWINVPELAALPWELLWDTELGAFLAIPGNHVVSRYLPVSEPPFVRAPERLHVLLVIASPESTKLPPIDVAEIERLKQTLTGLGASVELTVLEKEKASRDSIHNLLNSDYEVLHFLGHGRSGVLYLLDNDGKTPVPIDANTFSIYLQGRGLRLVVLNACGSSQEEEGSLFSGIGPSLVEKGLPAVIAMQYPTVYQDAAASFSEIFYKKLASGLSVDVAVNEARLSLYGKDQAGRDWSTPVLYMGTRSGRILHFPEAISEMVQEVAKESGQAAVALEEVTFRASRLREWFTLQNELNNTKIDVDAISERIRRAFRYRTGEHTWADGVFNSVDDIHAWWKPCKEKISRLKSLRETIQQVTKPLPNIAAGSDPAVKTWFQELDQYSQEVASLLEDELVRANEPALAETLGKLQERCRVFGNWLRDRSYDSQLRLDLEAVSLSEITRALKSQIHV